jgi:hypothetical protein
MIYAVISWTVLALSVLFGIGNIALFLMTLRYHKQLFAARCLLYSLCLSAFRLRNHPELGVVPLLDEPRLLFTEIGGEEDGTRYYRASPVGNTSHAAPG